MNLWRLAKSHLFGPYGLRLLAVLTLQAVQAAATLSLPTLNARLIDDGVIAGDNSVIRQLGLLMVVFASLQIVVAGAAVFVGSTVAMGFGRDLRRDVFHRITSFSGGDVVHFGAPSLVTRVTNDIQQVQQLAVMVATMMIAAPMMLAIGLVLALRTDVGLSKVYSVAVPVTVVVLASVIVRMLPGFQKMQERIDRLNLVLREQITGMRVVRAFVRESQEVERFADANREVTEVSLLTGRLMTAVFPTVGLILNSTLAAIVWFGSDRVLSGRMDVGAWIAFNTYTIQILMGVVMVTFMVSQIPRAGVAADRIVEVLAREPSIRRIEGGITNGPEPGVVELQSVSFRYPGAERCVVEDVSLRIEPGRMVAIIGSTGSGKSTIANLVARLIDPTAGRVMLDGVDRRELDDSVSRGRLGLVPQTAYLFSGTIASNLRFGRAEADEEELWAALRIAQAYDFVRAMPDGLDTAVNQGGTNLSGGQRQRLCIARALVARPDVLVFDDSFSALDAATDAALRQALIPTFRSAATLVIAQRASTVRHADEILVIENGEVVGRGTHESLVGDCETYREIVESQLGTGAAL